MQAHRSIGLSILLAATVSIYPSTYLCIYIPTYLSIYMYAYAQMHMAVCQCPFGNTAAAITQGTPHL